MSVSWDDSLSNPYFQKLNMRTSGSRCCSSWIWSCSSLRKKTNCSIPEYYKQKTSYCMMYKQTTQVPNHILGHYLKALNASELKILLVVIRQTYVWIDKRTGKRKTRDRISQSQFKSKTGLCSKIISKGIQNLHSHFKGYNYYLWSKW